jgi:hypothetical protein
MCCICFGGLTPETCAVDFEGNKWDICQDPNCIAGAGLETNLKGTIEIESIPERET